MDWLNATVETRRSSFRNRIVMAPMTRRMSPSGTPTAEVIQYYKRRIDGGVGGIITEGILVDSQYAGYETAVPVFNGRNEGNLWRELTSYAQDLNVPVLAQLWHQGSYSKNPSGYFRIGPSGIGVDKSRETRAMTHGDIERTVRDFAVAGKTAINNGFSGVEVHGAHGYLLDSFKWHKSNLRDDLYGGGDIRARLQFPAQVVRALRDAIGAGLISYRFSQWKTNLWTARNFDSPEELQTALNVLVDAGVDIFHVSTRRFWAPAFPELSGADGSRSLAGWVKRLSELPTIAVGSIGIPQKAEERSVPYSQLDFERHLTQLEQEEIDLVAVGRALLSDPHWAAKALERDLGQVRAYTPEDKLKLL